MTHQNRSWDKPGPKSFFKTVRFGELTDSYAMCSFESSRPSRHSKQCCCTSVLRSVCGVEGSLCLDAPSCGRAPSHSLAFHTHPKSKGLCVSKRVCIFTAMFEAEALELPLGIPKSEKSKAMKALDQVREFARLNRERGLVPLFMLPGCLGVSQQRVDQFVQAGRLETVLLNGHRYVAEAELARFVSEERKTGRPPKTGYSFKQAVADAKALLK